MDWSGRNRRGWALVGAFSLVAVAAHEFDGAYFVAQYEAHRVRLGESRADVVETLGEPNDGISSGPMRDVREAMFYGELAIGVRGERVVSIRVVHART